MTPSKASMVALVELLRRMVLLMDMVKLSLCVLLATMESMSSWALLTLLCAICGTATKMLLRW